MVPQSIREVPRPPNTVVIDTKSKSCKRWSVRSRIGSKRTKGNNFAPINGPIIGYISNGQYVDKASMNKPTRHNTICVLQYGPSALIYHVCKDIIADLTATFELGDAYRLMCMASLKVIYPGITSSRFKNKYEGCALSKFYPTIGLSGNSVSKFLKDLGRDTSKHIEFYAKRLSRVSSEQNIIIDGMLKQDTGNNDLSRPFAKTHLKGHKEISVIYAYSHDMGEVLCSKVYPGNMLDAKAFRSFVSENRITKGIIVCDKGFPVSKIREQLKANPDLHYIAPYKLNAKVMQTYKLTESNYYFETPAGNRIRSKKVKTEDGKYLYSIRDIDIANNEEGGFFKRTLTDKGHHDSADYEKSRNTFGLIVFESDLDLPIEQVLEHYFDRWWLEIVFDQYKNTLDLDLTRVQERESVIGVEFVNYLSTLILCKVRKAIMRVDALYYPNSPSSFTNRMTELREIYRRVEAPALASVNDGYWVETPSSNAIPLLARLGAIEDPTYEYTIKPEADVVVSNTTEANGVQPVRKPGRPKGSHSKKTVETVTLTEASGSEPLPKRKPGRPKGSLNKKTIEAMKRAEASGTDPLPKRKPGRPKGSLNKKTIEAMKHAEASGTEPLQKRKPGRPKGSANKVSPQFKRNFVGPMPLGQKHPAIRANTNPKLLWP